MPAPGGRRGIFSKLGFKRQQSFDRIRCIQQLAVLTHRDDRFSGHVNGFKTVPASGQFTVGDIVVNRLGFGAMRITGPGIWGEPVDRPEAVRTLRRLPELGVNFVDTADSYGPYVSENLIREALFPYAGMLIATKGGLTRQGPDRWAPVGRRSGVPR